MTHETLSEPSPVSTGPRAGKGGTHHRSGECIHALSLPAFPGPTAWRRRHNCGEVDVKVVEVLELAEASVRDLEISIAKVRVRYSGSCYWYWYWETRVRGRGMGEGKIKYAQQHDSVTSHVLHSRDMAGCVRP